jgi:hypothetical protein
VSATETLACVACGEPFERRVGGRGRKALRCARPECIKARKGTAVPREARDRQPAAGHDIVGVLADAEQRACAQDERLFFTRLAAFRKALDASEDHAPVRDALVDLIASAACWASVIDPALGAEHELPGPRWPLAAKPAAVITPPSVTPCSAPEPDAAQRTTTTFARQRYLEALHAHAESLDPGAALDRLERALGLAA